MSDDGRWTEGACGDGAAILFDGEPVPINELLRLLNERRDIHGELQAARGDERECCARQAREFIKTERLTGSYAALVERIARSIEIPF